MNEDIAPFELAVKLKEKGFDEPCYGYYHCNGGNDSFELCGNGDCDFLNSKNKHRIAAPTISQVLKWLRNTQNLHVETYPCGLGMWKFLVTNIITLEERALCDKYTSSEQAAIAGISYVLDNLI